MKTINLINKYFRILEQDEQPSPDIDPNAQQDQQAPSAEPEPEPILAITQGEKDLTNILIDAFTHRPSTDEDLAFINKINRISNISNPKEIVGQIKAMLLKSQQDKSKSLTTPVTTKPAI